jgi:hypothetical protein
LTLVIGDLFPSTVVHDHRGDGEAPIRVSPSMDGDDVALLCEDSVPLFDLAAAVSVDLRAHAGGSKRVRSAGSASWLGSIGATPVPPDTGLAFLQSDYLVRSATVEEHRTAISQLAGSAAVGAARVRDPARPGNPERRPWSTLGRAHACPLRGNACRLVQATGPPQSPSRGRLAACPAALPRLRRRTRQPAKAGPKTSPGVSVFGSRVIEVARRARGPDRRRRGGHGTARRRSR